MEVKRLTLRQATIDDIPTILPLYLDAQQRFAEQEIDQWQNNYPNCSTLEQDIANNESYVVMCEDEIVATVMLSVSADPTYNRIEGEWLTPAETSYMVIHRMTVNPRFLHQGIARYILDKAMQMCKDLRIYSIRVDTHQNNTLMSSLLQKKGFVFCGVIYVHDGSARNAFEHVIRRRYVM